MSRPPDALAIFLYPSELQRAKAAGDVRDEPDGTMTTDGPVQVYEIKPLPMTRGAR